MTTKAKKLAKTTKAPNKTAKTAADAPRTKKMSQIDAAIRVLQEAGQPMNCVAMVEAMGQKGLWSSPGGKTPHATLYTAVTKLPKLPT